jgi:tRNA(Ile)-lysidine synthase
MMRSPGASPAPDAALTQRLAAALGRLNPGSARIGLAVSGGPDSMAMLLLADAAIPGGFAVATVNHGLRAEAAQECALVAAVCAARGIDCAVLDVEVAGGNVQREARRARYSALSGWAQTQGLAAIATAHHADDQAETLLMRLGRGSGVAGLAGVREQGEVAGAQVIRPLLGFRREELVRVTEAAGIAAAQDPSNADPHYDRVRMRQNLASCDWLDPSALAHSADLLADAEEALNAFEDSLWPVHVQQEGAVFVLVPPSIRLMRVRLARRIIAALGGSPRGGDVARLVERLEQGEGGNVGGVLATIKGGKWRFRLEPARRG